MVSSFSIMDTGIPALARFMAIPPPIVPQPITTLLFIFLSHIPKNWKLDNLCLGGGCALNVLANSKILEQGIYKNVHVNTAPNDDGLHFGAVLYKSAEYEHKITLPDDIGYLGIPYTDENIEVALC